MLRDQNPTAPDSNKPEEERRFSLGFALFWSKKQSVTDEEVKSNTETRALNLQLSRGLHLPEDAWRSDNIDRLHRTTQGTETTPPFQRYEKQPTLRYLEEDVSIMSQEEYLSSQALVRLRLVLGWLSLLTPLPLLLQPTLGFHSLYVVVTTALLWLVRPVPLCVSALFPIVALPLIGILDAETVCGLYFNESVLLCLSSSLMACLAQRQGLQKRLTVACLRCLGGSIRCVLFVLMSTTALCAMMFSAPAAAHAAIPIVETLARELHRKPVHTAAAAEAPGEANEAIERHRGLVVLSVEEFSLGEERADSIRKVLLIAVVLSAIISAPASLTGASANMFLKGFLEIEGFPNMVTFSRWITANVICAIGNIVGLWIFIVFLYIRKMEKLEPGIHETVKGVVRTVTSAESEKLKLKEGIVIAAFGVALLMVYNECSFVTKLCWPELFGLNKWVDEATPFICAIIFVLIATPSLSSTCYERMAFWSQIETAIPWSTLIVMGAGFALTKAMQKTSMVVFLSSNLPSKPKLSLTFMQVALCTVVSVGAELRGGVALCSLILPFVLKLSETSHWHPLRLLLPVTLSCSMGLFFSVSSPANSLLMAKERINISNLAVSGLFAHLIFVSTAITMTNTIAPSVFNMTDLPLRGTP